MTVYSPGISSIVSGHKQVRAALRDTATYSSDLQGDADVRDYRQIPLEVDPPRHHLYRTALAPYFVKPRIEQFVPPQQKEFTPLFSISANFAPGIASSRSRGGRNTWL
mgnify:CR=1 FL=1